MTLQTCLDSHNDWLYQGEPFVLENEDYVGFVYIITNLKNGRRYLGKKTFFFTNRVLRVVKLKSGEKKKKKVTQRKESDWKVYYGSSKELLDDIEREGVIHFKRDIIHLCKTKGSLSYMEAKSQFDYDVLLSDDWYNGQIQCRINKNTLKF